MISYKFGFIRNILGEIGWEYGCSDVEPGNHKWIKKQGNKTHDVYDAPQSHSLQYSFSSHLRYSHCLAQQTHFILLFRWSTSHTQTTSVAENGTGACVIGNQDSAGSHPLPFMRIARPQM